jgi:thioredoxin reductase (NADPH)
MLYLKQVGNYQNYILKPIHDIPGFPVLAGDLVSNLMEQIKQFEPGFTLGERAETRQTRRRKFYCNFK